MRLQRITAFSLIMCLMLNINAQTNKPIKIHAYSMTVTGGAAQVDENGQQINNNRTQYLIYFETKSRTKPTINKIWIKGNLHAVSMLEMNKLPIISYSENKQIVLVPKTKNKVWQLLVEEAINNTEETNKKPKEVNTNDLVIIPKVGSQKHIVKTIKLLPNLIAP